VQTNSHNSYHFHLLLPKLRNRQVNLSLLSDEQEKVSHTKKRENKQTHNAHITSIHPSSASQARASKPSKANLSLLSEEKEKVFHNNEQESKQTHNAHITSIFCFPSFDTVKSINLSLLSDEQEKIFHNNKQESKQTHKTNHFHLLLPMLQKPPSQSASSLDVNRRRRSSKYKQTRANKLTKQLITSIFCFLCFETVKSRSVSSDEQNKVFHKQGLPQQKTGEQTNPQNKSLPSSASHAMLRNRQSPSKSLSSSFNEDRTGSSKYIQTHTTKLTILPHTNHVTTISRFVS